MVFDRNKDGKVDSNDFFTGEDKKKLLVHVMQGNIEVTKPIKTAIYSQQVEWNRRIFPISHQDFITDHKGEKHLYVEANNLSTKRFGQSIDKCKDCGKKMSIDARNARDLLKRKTIEAIWGIDSTHIILLMVMGIALLAAIGFAMYVFNSNQALQGKINSAIATGDTTLLLDKKPTTITKPANEVVR